MEVLDSLVDGAPGMDVHCHLAGGLVIAMYELPVILTKSDTGYVTHCRRDAPIARHTRRPVCFSMFASSALEYYVAAAGDSVSPTASPPFFTHCVYFPPNRLAVSLQRVVSGVGRRQLAVACPPVHPADDAGSLDRRAH